MTEFVWGSDACRARVRELWVAQGMTATEIAKLVKAPTRNAVLGVINRAGLIGQGGTKRVRREPSEPKPRPVVSRAPAAPRPIRAAKPEVSPAPVSSPLSVPIKRPAPVLVAIGHPVVLADLPFRGACKFPVGRDPGVDHMDQQMFCAQPVDGEAIYCAGHRRMAFTTPAAARKQSDASRPERLLKSATGPIVRTGW